MATDPTSNGGQTQQPAPVSAAAQLPPPPSPSPQTTPWSERLLAIGAPFYEWLSRPRVRLTVTGVILLIIGGLLMTDSVWTLPLVLAGALMVVIAWIGHRLDGRFAVEWGEGGTQLAFRAQIKPAQPALLSGPASAASSTAASTGPEQRPGRPVEPAPSDADVVEGEAHTVEIDVADLKALLAAAEAAEAKVTRADPPDQTARGLRVARSGSSADAPR